MAQHHDDDAPVWGAQAISKVIRRSTRQTYGLLEAGHLPARKVGRSYVAIPSKLRAHLAGETDGTA